VRGRLSGCRCWGGGGCHGPHRHGDLHVGLVHVGLALGGNPHCVLSKAARRVGKVAKHVSMWRGRDVVGA